MKAQTFEKFATTTFPATVTLADGQAKTFHGSLKDAMSWAIQQKSEIESVVTIDYGPRIAPKPETPGRAYDTVQSHIMCGGSSSDFTNEYLAYAGWVN